MPAKPHTPKQLTLIIDQGSHASRVAVFNEAGEVIYQQSQSVSTMQTAPFSYEQAPTEILQSITSLLKQIPKTLYQAIGQSGLCTQRSSIVAWNTENGQAITPLLSWRDTRNQRLIDELEADALNIQKISGLPLSAHYSASKIRWLLDEHPQTKQARKSARLCISPLASYLLFHLLLEKSPMIDHSNAQRSQLFDIHRLNWSSELLKLFDISAELLPECYPTQHHYGRLRFNNIPLTCVCGDQNAAYHAFPELKSNTALVNLGSGGFVLSPSPERSKHHLQLLQTLSRSNEQGPSFVTEGTVNGAGTALSWAQKLDPCRDLFSQLPEWLKKTNQPPIFINSISGLGSPWWCDAGEPAFTEQNTHLQSARYVAIIESILFLVMRNLEQLTDSPETLYISGGLAKLDGLCQRLADLTQARVTRFNETETTARGCAWLSHMEPNSLTTWQALHVEQSFIPSSNPPIILRYQQFVGELSKRCISN